MDGHRSLYHRIGTKEAEENLSHSPLALDVLTGLSRTPKALPSKYFYDEEGSRLFRRIMEQPEYYLTGCEREILTWHREKILSWAGNDGFDVVELGAGDGTKTRVLLEHFLRRGVDFRYVPVDICEEAVEGCVARLTESLREVEISGLVSEYFDGLRWLSRLGGRRNLVLFLGSNIGNFSSGEAVEFLHHLWNALNPDDLVLIGFDLLKDIEIIGRAYNDAAGVTAAFNRNLLLRINRELDADFDPEAFSFYSTFNLRTSAVESYLVSRRSQAVQVRALGQSFAFEQWEPLQTERSQKYRESDIHELAGRTGFEVLGVLKDSRGYFADALWRVRKDGGTRT